MSDDASRPNVNPALPIAVIGCRVFEDLLEAHLPPGLVKNFTFLDYGLHRWPGKLRQAVQAEIDGLATPSLIVLGYGLCGNGLDGVAARQHTLLISRAHDCIAVLLGSYERYVREFQDEPGTYYLTKGWLESGSHPLAEHQDYALRFGEEDAQWIMDQQYSHYKRLVFVAHSALDLERYRPLAKQVAAYCSQWGMRYEEILGSDLYVRRLVQTAQSLDRTDPDFLIVPPGGTIRQADFLARSSIPVQAAMPNSPAQPAAAPSVPG